jgi:hypothetical protein
MKKFSASLVLVILFVFMAVSASATPFLIGTVNFGSPVANVTAPTLDTATFVGMPSFTVITPATGDFTGSLGTTGTALNIAADAPLSGFLTFDGFTVDVLSFSGPDVWNLTSLPNNTTFASLGANVLIHKTGFADTTGTLSLSAQYPGAYSAGQTVAWSGNLSTTTPEPTTFVLMGAGLGLLGMVHRRQKKGRSS